jgi:tetratricopeptide (TPR) repeat protein
MSDNNPVHEMIQQFNQKLSDRVVIGEFDYQKDMATLERYLGVAEELGAHILLRDLYNTVGKVQDQACYPSLAIGAWQQALDLHLQHSTAEVPVVGYEYNIALALQLLDRHETAVQTLDRLYETFLSIEGSIQHYGFLLLMMVADTIYSQLALGRVFDAVTTNTRLDSMEDYLSITYNRNFTRALVKLWSVTAELHLAQADYGKAWSAANLSMEQATALNDHGMRTRIAFTRLHIAEQDEDMHHQRDALEAQAEAALNKVTTPSTRGRELLLEARYRRQQGYTGIQQRLAQRAFDIFKQEHAEEGMELARSLLTAPPPTNDDDNDGG